MARSEYLDNGGGVGDAIANVAGTLYGWSALSMVEEMQKTGQYYVPWAQKWVPPMYAPGIGDAAYNMVGGARKGLRKVGLGKTVGAMRSGVPAAEVAARGISRLGYLQLGVSKAVGASFTVMAWQDPVWFAMKYAVWKNPLMLAVGAMWFGGPAFVKGVARGLEKNKYMNFGGGYFPDSQAAFTSRQRAVRAISESQLQARSAIGNEAQLFHR